MGYRTVPRVTVRRDEIPSFAVEVPTRESSAVKLDQQQRRLVGREQLFRADERGQLVPLDVHLDDVWPAWPRTPETIERRCLDLYGSRVAEARAGLSIPLEVRPTAPIGHRPLDYVNPRDRARVTPKMGGVDWARLYRNHASRTADQSCENERHSSDVRTDVPARHARPNEGLQEPHILTFVCAEPDAVR
jgi:hypothetical protein